MVQVKIIKADDRRIQSEINNWLMDRQSNPDSRFKLLDTRIMQFGTGVILVAMITYDEIDTRTNLVSKYVKSNGTK